MKTKRHYLGAAIAALTVATFAGSAFADNSGSTGGSAVQEETSVTTAPSEQSSDAATEQTEIAPDTSTTSDPASSEDATTETASGDSAGWALVDSASSGSENGSTTSTNEESASPPPTETTGSDEGSHTTTTTPTEGQPGENNTVTPATCPSHAVIGAHFSIGATTATATFSIAPGCEGIMVMLASYTTPDPQKLFNGTGNTFSSGGPYTLTVNLPNCFFQIDLVAGQAPTVINAPFSIVIGAVGRVGVPCVEPPPTTTTTETTTTTPTTSTTETTTTTPTTSTTETTTTTPSTSTTTTTPVTSTVEGTTTSGSSPGNVAGDESGNAGNTNVLGVAAKVAALPFTGFSLALLSLLGAFLLLLGVGIRLAARRGAKQ